MSEIYFVENYKDLLAQIDIHQNIIDANMTSIKYYQKQLNANKPHKIGSPIIDGMPHGNNSPITFDRAYEEIRRCENIINIESDILARLQQIKKDLDDKIKALQGLYFKVAVLKHIEGKSLQQIADALGYSIGYIQNVSAQIEKGA